MTPMSSYVTVYTFVVASVTSSYCVFEKSDYVVLQPRMCASRNSGGSSGLDLLSDTAPMMRNPMVRLVVM